MTTWDEATLALAKGLVGHVDAQMLHYVDGYVTGNIGIFAPIGGNCQLAIAPAHSHPSYMFTLAFQSMLVRIEDKTVNNRTGTVMALSPSIPHQELTGDTLPRYMAIFIASELLETEAARYGYPTPAFYGDMAQSDPETESLIRRFIWESESDLPGRERTLESLGVLITHQLLRLFSNHKNTAAPSRDKSVQPAIDYLFTRLDQPLSVSLLASVAGLSVAQLTRLFKKETGMTPGAFIRHIRLDTAKRMLLDHSRSITRVAMACGFQNASHFAAEFAKAYGESPSLYRKRLQ